MIVPKRQPRPVFEALGRYIEKGRIKIGLSKASLGRMVGVSGPAIGHMVSGIIRPSQETMCLLAHCLATDDQLFDEAVSLYTQAGGTIFTKSEADDVALARGLPASVPSTVKVVGPRTFGNPNQQLAVIESMAEFLNDPANDGLISAILAFRQRTPTSVQLLKRALTLSLLCAVDTTAEKWTGILNSLETS